MLAKALKIAGKGENGTHLEFREMGSVPGRRHQNYTPCWQWTCPNGGICCNTNRA